MANMGDMARMMAAQGGMGMTGGPEPVPELEAPPEEGMEEAASDPMPDLSGALDTIEATIPQLPESVAEKIRQQVEAFRTIIEQAGTELDQEAPPENAELPAPAGAEGAMSAEGMEGA